MNIKAYFKLKNRIFLWVLWIFCISLFCLFEYFLIFEQKETVPAIIFGVVLVLLIFGLFCSEIYGIRIKDNKVRIISQYRVRYCKLEDINKLNIEFINVGRVYECYATLEMVNGKIYKFVWDKVRNSKGPDQRFNITEQNVDKYKEMLLQCDKVEVEIK